MIKIEQPVYKEPLVERALKTLSKFPEPGEKGGIFKELRKKYSIQKYATWHDDIKYKKFPNITPEEAWTIISFQRDCEHVDLPIKNEDGMGFRFWELPRYRKFFHDFDSLCGGEILSDSPLHKNTFIQNGELEESIYSSKIEGAVTTISAARKMIKEKIKPKNKDEQMIQNNYQTMQKIRNEWIEKEMSLDLLFEIHTSITENTDVKIDTLGRLRKTSDEVRISDEVTGEIAHIPPEEKFLEEQVLALIDFVNNTNQDEDDYFHPLVKAIALHFWIGYLHPFTDGNGRLARSLFYWYLLKHKYWAIPFLPISSKIIKSQIQYRDAFLLTEQVDNDFNYFLEYNIKQIQLAIKDFQANLKRIRKEKDYVNTLVQKGLNERQAELVMYFFMKPLSKTTIGIHKDYHRVSYLTARSDLLNLKEKGFLFSKKVGKSMFFFVNKDAVRCLFS